MALKHIIVCVKAVVLEAPGAAIVRSADACGLNPFDRPVLETALRLREAHGGTVTALSMGPAASAGALFEAMAMGADRGVLLCDPALAGADTFATSTALAAAARGLGPFDLLLLGTRTSDSDTGQVGPQTATALDLPLVTWAHEIEYRDGKVVARRRADGYLEQYAATPPCCLTIHPGAVRARETGLYGIEGAFGEKGVETWDLKKLGLDSKAVGKTGSPTMVISMARSEKKRKCEFISGQPDEQARELVRRLSESGLIG